MINSMNEALKIMSVKELTDYEWEILSLIHEMSEEFMEEHSDKVVFERVGVSLDSYPNGFSTAFLIRHGSRLPIWEISQRQEVPNILKERYPEKFKYRLINGGKMSTEKIKVKTKSNYMLG